MLSDSQFNQLFNPLPEQIPETLSGFLEQLRGPTVIYLNGRDRSRRRVVVTLLHGNEPSGFKALHRLLREGVQPEVDILLAIVSVDAALAAPLFSHRFLPGQQDMNRLFAPPYMGSQGVLAEQLLDIIRSAEPEAVLDMHNTSGNGPDFAVCIGDHVRYLDLAVLFTRRLVITDLRLGALMERTDFCCPVLTVECGGAQQQTSDRVALEGLRTFFSKAQLYRGVGSEKLDLYHHPVRLELKADATLCYDDKPNPCVDVTLPCTIDEYNFGVSWPDTTLAWLGPRGISALQVEDAHGKNVIDEYFVARDGKLCPRQMLKLFMITTNADIAVSDCLLYAVKEADHDSEATADDPREQF